jgi:SAM-dependent methyltransferase
MAASHPAGYLSELPYPDRFHRELSPTWLSYVGVQGGIPPRRLDGHFTYLDLGSGFAQSTIVNAGAFPRAEFHACDFNPVHIEAATRYAGELGVGNLALHEAVFEDLLERDLPQFDFIVLHGVYSWVRPEVCQTLRHIIARKLKPDGLVYVSYNCLPGWSAEAPLRTLMKELAAGEAGDVVHRMARAIDTMQRLANPSFRYFRDTAAAGAAVESFASAPANYVAHELLNDAWTLYYSTEVADDLELAGASYVASATLPDNHPMLVVDKQAADTIAKLPTVRQQQLAMDFAVNQRFRRDVFIGPGRAQLTAGEIARNLDDVVIGCLTEIDQIGPHAPIPRGKITFQDDFIRELRALMTRGAMTIGDTVARLSGAGRSSTEIRQNLVFLIAAGTLTPFAHAGGPARSPDARDISRVATRALAHIVRTGAPAVVPSERLGSGVLIGVQEAAQAQRWLAGEADGVPERVGRLLVS